MNGSPRAAIYTLGCRTNQYESDAIARALCEAGFEICDFSETCDVYIVNTCSVTAEADRKSRQLIRRCKKQNKNAVVIAAGCFSELNPEGAASIGADIVLGNRNKMRAVEFAVKAVSGKTEKAVLSPTAESLPYEETCALCGGKTRTYLKIEDGCDNHCAYCIIRKARGAVVSRPPENILREAREMVGAGVREIIITGTEVASYGRDGGGYTLYDAVKAVCKSGVERVRLGSVEPSVLRGELPEKLSGFPNFLPSFHFSLQSGSDKVLAQMRRKYNSRQAAEAAENIRRIFPGAGFSADIIVGFPGEDEDDFLATCRLCEEIGFYHLHIFPYSDRRGTEASARKDKIGADIINERSDRLFALGEKLSARAYGRYLGTGRAPRVLFEQRMGEYFFGHAENMLDVRVKTEDDLSGRIFDCIPEKFEDGALICTAAEEIK